MFGGYGIKFYGDTIFPNSTRVATMAATGMSGMTSLQCACNDVISNMASKTIDSSKRKQIRALEFYSGMGGMHYAMKRALDDEVAVVGAFDINTTVNSIYRHNFPQVSVIIYSGVHLSRTRLTRNSAYIELSYKPLPKSYTNPYKIFLVSRILITRISA